MRPDASPSQEWLDFINADENRGQKFRHKLIVAVTIVTMLLPGYFAFALPDQAMAKIEMEALQ